MRYKIKTFNRKYSTPSFESCSVVDIKEDYSLSDVIKNDLLYGVGNRPTIPSCFEDEDELKQDGVDPLSDMRHDSWHDASVAMNPTFQRTEQTIEVGSQVDTTTTEDTSKDE